MREKLLPFQTGDVLIRGDATFDKPEMLLCDTCVTDAVLCLAHKDKEKTHNEGDKTMKNMNNIVKALINGVLSWLLVALVLYLVKGVNFVQALTAPYTVALAITALVGSYIGFERKARKNGD